MRVIAETNDERLGLAMDMMPVGSTLSAGDGTWSVTLADHGWVLTIPGGAERAVHMQHIKPHADTQTYREGNLAADAASKGWHTAYGSV